MEETLTTTKNLGGRPPKITQDMVWEIIRVKGEYGISDWVKSIKLAKELNPSWDLPHYNNCILGIHRTFETMLKTIQLILILNQQISLKKTLK
jgi:hypothetical protein